MPESVTQQPENLSKAHNMDRCFVIAIKNGKQSCIGCGLSETEAMKIGSGQSEFDAVEVYINAKPFSVFAPKPKPKAKSKKA